MDEIIKMLFTLSKEINNISAQLEQLNKTRFETFKEKWIDAQDVMEALHISPRTLQSYRDEGILPYSQVRGKIYYKLSAIESMLDAHYSHTKNYGHGTK